MSPDRAVPILERLIHGLAAVYIFGSAARGDMREDSDLDLAIVVDGVLTREARDEARLAVEDDLGIDVDLIDLSTASPVLSREVLFEGRRIAVFNPFIADEAELRMMRDYADLKERRSGIEADIVRRGRVLA